MRVKRWLTPPRCRPPDPQAPLSRRLVFQQHQHRSLPVPPPPPSPPLGNSPLPPHLSYPPPPPQRVDHHLLLGSLLSSLPPISQSLHRIHSPSDLKQELSKWIQACQVAHSYLSGPLQFKKWKFRNSTVRVVGHTMRLLLRAGRIKEAKELDERFFGRGVVVVVGGQEGEGEGVDGKRKEKLGFGLGLDRGGIGVAWMQSIVVRLEEGQGGEFEGERAKEFGDLLKEMREKERGRVMSPLMLAFVVRRLEIIHERLRGAGKEKKGARRQIRGILKEIKGADEGGEELVSLALLDGAVEKLERQVEGEEVDMELFGEVERKIEGLVGTLEPDQLEEDLGVLTELHQRVPDAKSIDRHSHILYLAIRFLLLRARQQQTSTSSSQLISKDTLSSASQLYTLMLDLTPSVSRSILDLVQLRQRQSSALYRLLWAHLGFFDTPSTSSSSPSERLSDPPSTPDHELIASAYELIDLTLSSTSTLPPLFLPETTHLPSHISHDPLLVRVSTKFHRQALYLLSLPSSPSRRDQNLPSPPWSMFQHAFSLILAQRLHDSKRLKHDTRKPSKIPDWNLPLIVQPAFAIHLLRATLLSHSPNGTPLTRLGELVEFIEKLEQGGQERKARRLMWKAVGVVVEGEWKGEGAREWKELIKGKLRSWVREKEKESIEDSDSCDSRKK